MEKVVKRIKDMQKEMEHPKEEARSDFVQGWRAGYLSALDWVLHVIATTPEPWRSQLEAVAQAEKRAEEEEG